MKSILRITSLLSLLIFSINITIHGLVKPQSTVVIIIGGIILQRINDSLFKIVLTFSSFIFFLWSITNGKISIGGQLINGILTLLVMTMGISIMFRGVLGNK